MTVVSRCWLVTACTDVAVGCARRHSHSLTTMLHVAGRAVGRYWCGEGRDSWRASSCRTWSAGIVSSAVLHAVRWRSSGCFMRWHSWGSG